MPDEPIQIRPFDPVGDLAWAESTLRAAIGGRLQARRGELIDVLGFPGFVAVLDGAPGGLLTYRDDEQGCELLVIAASRPRRGIGSALVGALQDVRAPGEWIWVVTTNDNLDALAFYQRQGFSLRALRAGAVDQARRTLKPTIPRLGDHGIPLRDELELAMLVPSLPTGPGG